MVGFMGIVIRIDIRLFTWRKKSFGLYDQLCATEERTETRIFLTQDGFLLLDPDRSQNFLAKRYQLNPYTNKLRKLEIRAIQPSSPAGWVVEPQVNKKLQQFNLWMIHEEKKETRNWPLKEGQIFRFGRQVIEVRKIFVKGVSPEESPPEYMKALGSAEVSYHSIGGADEAKCRICLEGESEEQPFTRGICRCHDSLSIHTRCLLLWTAKRLEKKTKNGISFYRTANVNCEICRARYPSKISYRGKEVPIINIVNPTNTSFFILNLMDLEKDEVNCVAVISLSEGPNDQTFTVGRDEHNDIFLKDASVSREHSTFLWSKKELFLIDNLSKFGTLQLIEGRTSIDRLSGKKLVMDKFLFTMRFTAVRSLESVRFGSFPSKVDPFSQDPRLLESIPIPPSPPSSRDISIHDKPDEPVRSPQHRSSLDRQVPPEPSPFITLPTVQTLPDSPQLLLHQASYPPEVTENTQQLPHHNASFLNETNSQIHLPTRFHLRPVVYQF